MSSALHLDREHDRDRRRAAARSRCEPIASKRVSPVDDREPEPDRRRTRARTSAPVSSSSTTGSSGLFVRRMNCHQRHAAAVRAATRGPRSAARSTRAPPRRRARRTRRPGSRARAGGAASRCPRRARTARRGRTARARRRTPRSTARRRSRTGAPRRPGVCDRCAAEEQQALVAGVGERVDRLRHHRRRAGDQRTAANFAIAIPRFARNAAKIARCCRDPRRALGVRVGPTPSRVGSGRARRGSRPGCAC